MNLAPIVLFTYNRLDHTTKTVEALKNNTLALNSELFIYSDGPKNIESTKSVEDVRSYLSTISGFKEITIIKRERNYGLADSIVDGVTNIVNKYGKIIVLEDDIVTSPHFLQYMNDALDLYKDEAKVMHISGYFYPVDTTNLPDTFFYNQTSCWGWATWDRAWKNYQKNAEALLDKIKRQKRLKEFDMDGDFKFSSTLRANIKGTIKTWAIKWHASVFLQKGLCLHPKISLVENIGHDGTGTNSSVSRIFTDKKTYTDIYNGLEKVELKESSLARNLAKNFLKATKPNIIRKIIYKIWK